MIYDIDILTKWWLFLFICTLVGLVCSVIVSVIMDLLYEVTEWFTVSAYYKWHNDFVRPIKFYFLVAVLVLLVVAVLGCFIYRLIGEFGYL